MKQILTRMNRYFINKKTKSDSIKKFKINNARHLSKSYEAEKFMINNIDNL